MKHDGAGTKLKDGGGRGSASDLFENEVVQYGSRNLDLMRRHLREIATACSDRLPEEPNYASQLMGSDQVGVPFLAYRRDLLAGNEQGPLPPALRAYGEAQKMLLTLRKGFEVQIQQKFSKPIETFLDNDVQHALDTLTQYSAHKKAFDAVRAKVREADQQPKGDQTKLYTAHLQLVAAKEEFDNFQTHTIWELDDVNTQKDYVFLAQMRELMTSQLEYHRNCAKLFEYLEPLLESLQTDCEKERQSCQENKAKREMAWIELQAQKKKEKYGGLVALLAHPKQTLINALNLVLEEKEDSDSEAFLKAIVRSLDNSLLLVPLIQNDISQQVSDLHNPSTMFRNNTISLKLMSTYSKLVGHQYVVDTLNPPMRYFLSRADVDFEIDPNKSDGQTPLDVQANGENLIDLCKTFVDQIINSECPVPLRILAKYLRDEIGNKFGAEAGLTAVGGFIFLRLLCPNILIPNKIGLMDTAPSPKQIRTLILVTKSLQTLSNNTKESGRETYMQVMQSFFSEYTPRLYKWFDDLTTTIPKCQPTPLATLDELCSSDLPYIESICREHLPKLIKRIEDKYVANDLLHALAISEYHTPKLDIPPPPDSSLSSSPGAGASPRSSLSSSPRSSCGVLSGTPPSPTGMAIAAAALRASDFIGPPSTPPPELCRCTECGMMVVPRRFCPNCGVKMVLAHRKATMS
eukprot:TRINITY_DN4703_c0_g1_i1.p1 TRINITY_DN4703_c0_g1~~TRINITY_DN4703_c0_g1_i1.p1  ORF type:complete len:690 (+),score=177.69 TRINITY_DN4703_c0_g1_i1:98-2167(+)